MKKNDLETTIFNSDIGSTKHLEIDKFKTTNVNILLNRVKLDKKRTLKKRIIFVTIIASSVVALATYFIL